MSAFEQKREIPNRALQYLVVSPSFFITTPSHSLFFFAVFDLLFVPRPKHRSFPDTFRCRSGEHTLTSQLAAEPYETISFAIPSKDMVDDEEDPEATWEHWDADEKVYSCQLLFK
jgi:hypothetical protein